MALSALFTSVLSFYMAKKSQNFFQESTKFLFPSWGVFGWEKILDQTLYWRGGKTMSIGLMHFGDVSLAESQPGLAH